MTAQQDRNELSAHELIEVVALIDACANRFGPMSGQLGARKFRAAIFAAIERPGTRTWSSANRIFITAPAGQLTLGQAVNLYSDYDRESGPHPTGRQVLDALRGATA